MTKAEHHPMLFQALKKAAEAAFLAVIAESIRDYRATTFSAWGPFWPWVTVNSTCWPSARVLKPLP